MEVTFSGRPEIGKSKSYKDCLRRLGAWKELDNWYKRQMNLLARKAKNETIEHTG